MNPPRPIPADPRFSAVPPAPSRSRIPPQPRLAGVDPSLLWRRLMRRSAWRWVRRAAARPGQTLVWC